MAVTVTPAIDVLPPFPGRNAQPDDFNDKADAFTAALSPYGQQVKAVGDAAEANARSTQSDAAATAADRFATSQSRSQAAEFALTAINAPGTKATSNIPATLQTGPVDLVIQTGKAFAPGQGVALTLATDRSKRGIGYIDAYDPATGALRLILNTIFGAGTTGSNWIIALAADNSLSPATKEDLWGGTNNDKAATAFTLAEARKFRALTPVAGVITWDVLAAGWKVRVPLASGTNTLTLPSGLREGDVLTILGIQPASGAVASVLYPGQFKFGAAGAPAHSTANSAWDVCRAEVLSVSPYVLDAQFKKLGVVT